MEKHLLLKKQTQKGGFKAFSRLLLAFLLSFAFLQTQAQTTIAFQGFEGTAADTWAISGDGSTIADAANTGAQGRDILKNNEDVFAQTSVAGYTAVKIVLHTNVTGIENADGYEFYVDLNGAGYPATPDLIVQGVQDNPYNTNWTYSATGVATTVAGTPATFTGVGGDDAAGFATVEINIPAGTNTVALKVIGKNVKTTEKLYYDDVELIGTSGGSDTTPPSFSGGYPTTQSVSASGFDVAVSLNEIGTSYFVVLPDGATAPSSTQVKNGQDASGTAVVATSRATIAVTAAGTEFTGAASTLLPTTAYDVYVVAEDDEATPNLQTAPTLTEVTTTATGAPTVVVSTTSLNDFGNVAVNSTSAAQNYNVSGAALTADILITPPAQFEVSTDQSTWFTSTTNPPLTLAQSGGIVSLTTIYARFHPTAEGASGTLQIAHSSAGASTQNVSVSGTGTNDDYYAPAYGLTGEALKDALHDIIDNHTTISYDDVWDALRHTDEDPDNSNNVILLYTGRSQSKTSNGGNADDWNREHTWAKSHGDFGTAQGAGTDIHHLRPTDASVNSSRSNLDFDNGGVPHSEATECRYDSDSWEPRDAVKGDVARMLFYMATRYESGDGHDLELTNTIPSSPSGQPLHAKLDVLLEWHQNDPVDDWERNRNNIIYDDYQHNRNPFIDHPEYAMSIWGDCTAPTGQATNFSADNIDANNATVHWVRGNGDRVIVLAREGSAVNNDPMIGVSYTANAAFGSGDQLGSGNYVVYDGTGTQVTVTALASTTNYYFAVYEYAAADYCYNMVELTGNLQTTVAPEPSNHVTSFIATATGSASISLVWDANDGAQIPSAYLIKASTSDNVSAPVDGTEVADNLTVGDNTGAKNVAYGTNTFAWTGLQSNQTYYFKIYPYTNSGANIDYKTDGTIPAANATTLEEATIIFEQDFETGTFGDWTTYSVASDNNWSVLDGTGANSTAKFSQMNGYNGGNPVEDWLISPVVNLDGYTGEILTFYTRWKYGADDANNYLKLKYSSNYTGTGDPNSATWTELSFTSSATAEAWLISGNVNASTISGSSVYFAFHYYSTDSPTRWKVDEISLSGYPANTAGTWLGLSSDWNSTSNWFGAQVPTAATDVTIPDTDNDPVIDNINAVTASITVNDNATLSVNGNATLTANGNFVNNGNVILASTDNATSGGSLIDNGNLSGSGTWTMQRALAGSQWHQISFPTAVDNPPFSGMYVREHSEATNTFTYLQASGSPVLHQMQGYSLFKNTATTLNFTGTPNTGSMTNTSLTKTAGQYGWNLVGNAYPSSLNWDDVIRTNVNNAIYYWDANLSGGSYATYINGVGSPAGTTGIIAPMQAFFVQCGYTGSSDLGNNGTGSIQTNNGMRQHSNAHFYKSETGNNQLFRLSATGENGYSDEMVIRVKAASTANFDTEYDAYKMFSGNENTPTLYSYSSDNEKLTINTYPTVNEDMVIKLGFEAKSGTYTLAASEIQQFVTDEVYLYDWFSKKIIKLNSTDRYTFTHSENSNGLRFELRFKKGSFNEIMEDAVKIHAYQSTVYVNFTSVVIPNGTIAIYDLSGRKIATRSIENKTQNEIELSVSAGNYFVKVTTSENTYTQKVHIR